ncbi:MAG: carboxymuconolactone decarboxylase family protein [Odoribacter sp.]|nr:carboxymuconolactone decarboxylase family protein [Odoribacter sp.]
MRREFNVPKRAEIQERDRKLLYAVEEALGFVPNIYAFMTRSETALKRFLQFTEVPTVFDKVSAEAIHLVVSQVYQSPYCLAVHTALAREAGLTDSQIEGIRKGNVTWDKKLDTLVDFTCELVSRRGKMTPEMTDRFYGAGYTDACLVDLVMLVGMTTVAASLANVTRIPGDYPEAPVIVCTCNCKK